MFNVNCYLINCLTNLHAGSGDTNYGIIDKMIQRDPVTKLPTIYASSLKGAFREYFKHGPEKESLRNSIIDIFGAEVKDDDNDNSKGNTIFHEAQLIGIPVRSNQRPFFIATSKETLNRWLIKAKLLGLSSRLSAIVAEIASLPEINKGEPKIIGEAISGLDIEDYENVGAVQNASSELIKYLGNNILLMHDDDLKESCSDYSLPVIARNNLENGESKNLWYEQIVPHESRFVFLTLDLSTDKFSSHIHNKVVQIGANSSLGYGYCLISKL